MHKRSFLCLSLTIMLLMLSVLGYAESYTGTARGFGGDVIANVTIEDGKITNLSVTADHETAGIGTLAIEPMTASIVEANATAVDCVAGATITSNAIISAVNAALADAGLIEVSDVQSYTAGTYVGKSKGRIGTIAVEVAVSDSAIESVTIVESSESAGISDMPKAVIPQEIVAYQSLGVDTIAGATLSSLGIINATADALAQAGANVDALRAVPVEREVAPVENIKTQVVVAGAGMAGMMAAATAADQGAEVVLIEKLPFIGGCLNVAGGGLAIGSANKHMTEQGIEWSLEKTMEYVYRANADAHHQPDYEFIEYMMSESGKTDDYLCYDLAFPCTSLTPAAAAVNIMYGLDRFAAGMVDHFKKIFEEKGVKIIVNAAADEIILEDGKAVGLKVKAEGGDFTVMADKVIIATGGANYDTERMLSVNPSLTRMSIDHQPLTSNTGDGFRMFEQIGANMGDGPLIKPSSSLSYSTALGYTFWDNPSVLSSMIFDADGIRFVNEDFGVAESHSSAICIEMIRHGSEACYVLFDAHSISEGLKAKLQEYLASDNKLIGVYGKDIEEVAQKLDIDPAVLKRTYERYQTLAANGNDIDFGKNTKYLLPYNDDEGLYAVYIRPGSYGTVGGVLTDRQFHALNADGNAIDNLFAVGEVATSTLFGDCYMSAFSLSYYSTAGRLAAETAVAEINAVN